MDQPRPRILVITDPRYTDSDLLRVVANVGEALPRGALGVQIRDKKRERSVVRALAQRLRATTRGYDALLWVNGDVSLAREVGADGVHLGGDGWGHGPSFSSARLEFPMGFITVATHTNDEVERALALGADGVLVSPIFETPGAGKGSPRGVAALEAAARELEGRREKHAGAHAMIYGLGGIDASRARACAEAGAHGVAVIRAIFESNDPAKEAVAMWEALEKHSR